MATREKKNKERTPEKDDVIARALVDDFIRSHGSGRCNTIALLQAVHDRLGYLPREAMAEIAGALGISETNVFSVASFYNQFRFVPPGRHPVKVCMGTACHIKGGQAILDVWKHKLGIDEGEVTEDREHSLDRVACVGCCAIAPVMLVGDRIEGHVMPSRVDGVLLAHELEQKGRQKEREESGECEEGEGSR